jgi:hypothetical protein
MKLSILVTAVMLGGCYGSGALAPDYALGTYRGSVIGRGTCPSPAAQLTVNVTTSSAYGDWYFEQRGIRIRFTDGWVHDAGFLSSIRTPEQRNEYVSGLFTPDGSAIDANIDTGSCLYTGRLLRT